MDKLTFSAVLITARIRVTMHFHTSEKRDVFARDAALGMDHGNEVLELFDDTGTRVFVRGKDIDGVTVEPNA